MTAALTAHQITVLDDLSNRMPELKRDELAEDKIQLGTTIDGIDDRLITVEASAAAAQVSLALFGDAVVSFKKIAIVAGSATTEIDTGWALPAHAVVNGVWVETKTAEATGTTKTVKVGTLSSQSGGVQTGFLNGVSVATAGLFGGGITYHSGTDYPTATTFGALLADFTAGTATDDRGLFVPRKYLTDSATAKNISWTRASAFTEFAGYIWIEYATLIG